jgi:hypothetical protein
MSFWEAAYRVTTSEVIFVKLIPEFFPFTAQRLTTPTTTSDFCNPEMYLRKWSNREYCIPRAVKDVFAILE